MTESASTALLGNADLLAVTVGTWRLDPASTTIEIHTKAIWGLAKVKGTFGAASGTPQCSAMRMARSIPFSGAMRPRKAK